MSKDDRPGVGARRPPPFELRDVVAAVLPDVDPDLAVLHLALLQIGRMVEVPARAVVAADGLETSDGVALVALLFSGPGARVTASALSEIVVQTRSGMAKTLRRLGAAGLVEQTDDPHDRRARLIHLTPAGAEMAGRHLRLVTQSWQERLRLDRRELVEYADAAWALLRLVDPTYDPGPPPERSS